MKGKKKYYKSQKQFSSLAYSSVAVVSSVIPWRSRYRVIGCKIWTFEWRSSVPLTDALCLYHQYSQVGAGSGQLAKIFWLAFLRRVTTAVFIQVWSNWCVRGRPRELAILTLTYLCAFSLSAAFSLYILMFMKLALHGSTDLILPWLKSSDADIFIETNEICLVF